MDFKAVRLNTLIQEAREHTLTALRNRERVITKLEDESWSQNIIRVFGMAWTRSGFPVVRCEDLFAGSCMATEIATEVRKHIQMPWEAFVVSVPPGVLFIGEDSGLPDEVWYMLAMKYGNRYFLGLNGATGRRLFEHVTNIEDLCLPTTINTMLHFDGSVVPSEQRETKALELAGRLFLGICCAMTNSEWVQKTDKRAHANWEANANRVIHSPRPQPLGFRITAPVTVNVLPEIRRYQLGSRTGRLITVRTIVAGHWRHQAHGPKHTLRKWLFIQPFCRGPEDAPLPIRPHIIKDPVEKE